MTIYLHSLGNKLTGRLRRIESAFSRHVIESCVHRRIDRFALQEGLVSSLWQSWSVFCREVVVSSARGARTSTGLMTSSPYAKRTEMEIAFAASQLANNRSVGRIRALASSRYEPTWGDVSKINRIVLGLNPSNSGNLLGAFGACSRIQDLQLCRNACSHLTAEMVRHVRTARVRYTSTSFTHPSDLMFWVDPTTNDFAWVSCLDEMRLIAQVAIE